MIEIKNSMVEPLERIDLTDDEIESFVNGLIETSRNPKAMDEFIERTPYMHLWKLPSANPANWDEIEDYFKAQTAA